MCSVKSRGQGIAAPPLPDTKKPSLSTGLRNMVGEEGFEPPTLWSQTRCATKLRYSPTCCVPWERVRILRIIDQDARGFVNFFRIKVCSFNFPPAKIEM